MIEWMMVVGTIYSLDRGKVHRQALIVAVDKA